MVLARAVRGVVGTGVCGVISSTAPLAHVVRGVCLAGVCIGVANRAVRGRVVHGAAAASLRMAGARAVVRALPGSFHSYRNPSTGRICAACLAGKIVAIVQIVSAAIVTRR